MDGRSLLRVLLRWKWMIALVGVVCAGTSTLVSMQLPKVYASTAVALVNPQESITPTTVTNPNQLPDLTQVVATYAGLVNTGPVRDRLTQDGVPRTSAELSSEIIAIPEENTTLIAVSVYDNDPQVAQLIARDIVPSFNAALDQLQSSVPGSSQAARLQAMVPWDLPSAAPTTPVSPDVPRNSLLALVGGLVAAGGLAFVLERIDNTVKAEDDVPLKLGVSVLGTVVMHQAIKGGNDGVETITVDNVEDLLSEEYRALRTNVLFSRVDAPLRSIVVTSSMPREGKTTTACNLAVVMAQAGNEVILVDADFRRPSLHRVFSRAPSPGLGNLILGDEPDGVLVPTNVPRLRIVTAGPTPPNPSELLGSERMDTVVQRLMEQADVVIFDTPPLGAVTDATVLATLTDCAILVVERGRTSVPVIERSLQTLRNVHVDIAGVVLNKARSGDSAIYYDYYGTPERQRAGGRKAGKEERAPGGHGGETAGETALTVK